MSTTQLPTPQCNSTSIPSNEYYLPRVDDYVRWNHNGHVDEGWVYFVGDEYLTIEVSVKDKPKCEYTKDCLLYTSPSPRDATLSRMPSSA